MISKYLLEPTIGDLYVWKNGDRLIIYNAQFDGVAYFYNGKDFFISKWNFPYFILSLSNEYEFSNVNQE